ncbi:hypothetical protein GCM10027569_77210 [Flindersiella endophytica]
MHGLLQVDVTEARRLLRAHDPRLSFTAYVVACVARAAAAHPEVHAYKDKRGRLATPSYVDVGILLETSAPTGPVPVGHLLHDADVRQVADLSAEIRFVQADSARISGARKFWQADALARIPGVVPLFSRLIRGTRRLHAVTGTVGVSSIGMFGRGGGLAIGIPTVHTVAVTVGGMSERPWVVDGTIQVRTVLDLTISVDHDLVDGAPAARFAASLRELLESAKLL